MDIRPTEALQGIRIDTRKHKAQPLPEQAWTAFVVDLGKKSIDLGNVSVNLDKATTLSDEVKGQLLGLAAKINQMQEAGQFNAAEIDNILDAIANQDHGPNKGTIANLFSQEKPK